MEQEWDPEEPEPDFYLGKCDADGCIVIYELASTSDHCIEEGLCWAHCTNQAAHTLGDDEQVEGMLGELIAVAESKGVDVMAKQWKVKPLLFADAVQVINEPAPADTIGQAYQWVQQALEAGPQQVHEVAKALLDKTMGEDYEPTQAERVALFVAGLEAIARSEHGTVVAYTEGRTLDKHMADFSDNECGVCENLKNYMTNALDLLRPMAEQEADEAKQAEQTLQYVKAGVCGECGEPPYENRRYSLEEGQGFLCAYCAGPYLLMDDGKPGIEPEVA